MKQKSDIVNTIYVLNIEVIHKIRTGAQVSYDVKKLCYHEYEEAEKAAYDNIRDFCLDFEEGTEEIEEDIVRVKLEDTDFEAYCFGVIFRWERHSYSGTYEVRIFIEEIMVAKRN